VKNPLSRAALAGTAVAACAVALAGCGAVATSTTSATTAAPAATSVPQAAAVTFPLTVKDGSGASVTIKAKPTRIVSLSPTATEDLYADGAGSQVVAVDSDSDYPTNAPKTSLSGLTPNIEAIAKYNPSLVIASENSNGLVAGLAKLGVPVLIEPAASNLTGAYDQIEQIGQVTGHASQAASLVASMKTQIAKAVNSVKSSTVTSYYWELSAAPYYSATSQTFIGQIVSLFGLTNIADKVDKATDGGYPELSEEYIVSANPQMIFLADNDAADGGQTPAIVEKRAGWSGISAVANKDVFALNDDIASRWGPRIPQLVAEIASAVNTVEKQEQAQATQSAG
jgi:iron complex transport system substrate-binding protein